MNVVWAVSSGSYSDYQVHALFTSEEDADAAVELLKADANHSYWGDARVEEFPLYDRAVSTALRIEQAWYGPRAREDVRGKEYSPDTPHSRLLKDQIIPEWELRRSTDCATYANADSLCVEGTDFERVRKVFSEKLAIRRALPWLSMTEKDIRAALDATEDTE